MSQFDDILAKHGIQSQEQTEDDPFDAILKKHGINGGKPEETQDKGFFSNTTDLAVGGAKSALTAARLSGDVATGSFDKNAPPLISRALQDQNKPKPKEMAAVEHAFAGPAKEYEQAGSWSENPVDKLAAIGKTIWTVGEQAITNPKGTAYLTASQIANMAPSIVGMMGGAKTGALAGSLLGPAGTAAGAITGGLAGGFAGEWPMEAGSEFIGTIGKELQRRGLENNEQNVAALLADKKFMDGALSDVRTKATTTSAVDAAFTLGAGRLATGPARAAEKAARAELGVGANAAQIASRAKEITKARTIPQKIGTGAKAVGLDVAGGGASEAAGQYAGYGAVDLADVGMEMLGELGGAGIEVPAAAWSYGKSAIKGTDQDADLPADDILTQPAPTAFDAPVAPKPTAAEQALADIKPITALDRVAALDTEGEALLQRKNELAQPDYGPMFDAERAEVESKLAGLMEEREAITKTWPKAIEGTETNFTTEAGARLNARYALMEAGDLTSSHDENLRPSPVYPSEMQPRQRDRAASEMQISGIVQKLDPARLGESPDAATGAPIVGADGLVESGNARTIALKRVYQANGAKADAYRQFLKDNAARFGLTLEQVETMQRPVLVRVRATPVDRAEFARQANASTVAQMSPSEQARADSARIDSLDDLNPDEAGDFTSGSSRGFVRRFMASLPGTEQAGMIDATGQLSQSGYIRMRNAILAKAYGDSPVLLRMVESLDNNLRGISNALMRAAPAVAKSRQAIAEGAMFDADITPDLMAAVEELSRIKDAGRSVEDALAQSGMFGEQYSPETRELLQFLADNIRRPRKIADFLQEYFSVLEAAGHPAQTSLMGETRAPSKGELLTAARGVDDAETEPKLSRNQETGGQDRRQPGDEARDQGGAQGDEGEKGVNKEVDESKIVNPIDLNASPAEKVRQLEALSQENAPIIEKLLDGLRAKGIKSKTSFKETEKILSKAVRPSILAKKPWHGVEHIRDAYRFKSVPIDIRQLADIAQAIKDAGIEVVKIDTAKMFKPKEWGWRFVAVDLRMPNGQLVEYYSPVKELESAKKARGHQIFEDWRNKDLDNLNIAEWTEYQEALNESNDLYEQAFDEYLARTGQSFDDVRAAVKTFEMILGSETRVNSSLSSSAVTALRGNQTPSTKVPNVSVSASNTKNLRPSSDAETTGFIATPSKETVPQGGAKPYTGSNEGGQDVNAKSRKSSNQGQVPDAVPATGEERGTGRVRDDQGGGNLRRGRDVDDGDRGQERGEQDDRLHGEGRDIEHGAKSGTRDRAGRDAGVPDGRLTPDEKLQEGLAEFGAVLRQYYAKVGGARMLTPEESAKLMPALIKILEALYEKGTKAAKALIAQAQAKLKKHDDEFIRTHWNKITPADYAAAAQQAIENIESRDQQGDLFAAKPQKQGGFDFNAQPEKSPEATKPATSTETPAGQPAAITKPKKAPPAGRDIPPKTGRNFVFGDNDLTYEGSWVQKATQNVEAVEMLKKLEADGRQATREEQAVLAKFIGWGASEIANTLFGDKLDSAADALRDYDEAIANLGDKPYLTNVRYSEYRPAFNVLHYRNPDLNWYTVGNITREMLDKARPAPATRKWLELRDRLQAVMTDQEWAEASRSTQYAHYTSKPVVKAMWRGMERMGFKGGYVLEPGAGIGVFPGLMPQAMAHNSSYTGIEFDSITGGILKQLFPDERVLVESFVDTQLPPNFFTVAAGNPPFGNTPILADPKYRKLGFALHDYFFAKTIDSVQPGGLVMFVSSRYTMDKLNDKARAWMSERADLVGAIRLPQTAFQKNAGTEVVTDVLFLRKKVPGETFEQGQAWAKSVPITVNGTQYNINEYFAAHPEMVLGKHSDAGSMYGDKEYTVEPLAGDIEAQFDKAVDNLPQDILRVERGSAAEAAAVREIDFNPKAQKEGNYYVTDAGVLMQRENGVGVRVEKKSEKDIALIKDFVGLRDALKQAHYDQLNEGDWEKSLAALQKAYRAFVAKHGRINQFKEYKRTEKATDEETGETYEDERSYKRFPLWSKLDDDPEFTRVIALEDINDDTGEIAESKFLTDRVLGKPVQPEIRTPQDALLSVLNDVGKVDLAMIAGRLGMEEADVVNALGTAIYQDPSEGWVMADEYLSGNVKEKLEQAINAARSDRRYERNVEALREAQPTPKTSADIMPQLGMSWIPAEVYQQFLQEKAGVNTKITYNKAAGMWAVEERGGSRGAASTADWGTGHRPAHEILDHALNGRPIRITTKDSDGKTVFLEDATELANQKLAQMKQAFSDWLWTDAARANNLVRLYNDRFNVIVPRKFDGRHLTLPGTSQKYHIFDHVKRGAWRIIQSGNTYLAHAVGSGKTFQMVISAMEQKRLGLVKKPMIVVPNHMLQQFAREWMDLYPAAKLMVADEKNFHTDNRRRWVSRVALSDVDGVIITHSAFKLLDIDPDFKKKMVDDELTYLRAAYQDAGGDLSKLTLEKETDKKGKTKVKVKASGQKDPTIKQIERNIEAMEQRLLEAMSGEGKDTNVLFNELGVDTLYVDEAHEYRKLAFTTRRQVKGVDPSGSARAFDMWVKTRWLKEKNPKRFLVLASGTPVTNTMAELYSVQKLMDYDTLEAAGLEDFDSWAAQFGAESTALEQTAAGGYDPVTRFNKFVNVGELIQMFRQFADVLTSDHLAAMLGDKRPKVEGGGRKLMVAPKTDLYTAFLKQELQPRMEASKTWKPSKDQPNNPDPVIKIIGDGRLAAIDMRFMHPELPNDPDSKLNRMIDGVIKVYKETGDIEYTDRAGKPEPLKGAAQMVFSDLGFGAGVTEHRGFNARAWFEKRLRDAGIPPSQVAFMSDYKKSDAKLKLFKDVNAGRVRILVGSSKNMGTGVNAQQRLIAMHHLDAPWYPADLEQREGRIIRQGNKNKVVQVYAHAMKGTYDEQMWAILARKQFFIDQALSGDVNVREIEDVSEVSNLQQASAMLADDPRLMEAAGLKADIEKLERLYRAHEESRARMYQAYNLAGELIRTSEPRLAEVEKQAARVQDLTGDKFKAKADGQTFDKRKEWGEAIIRQARALVAKFQEGKVEVGSVSGFPVVFRGEVRRGPTDGAVEYRMSITLQDVPEGAVPLAYDVGESVDPVGLSMRATNALADVARAPEKMRNAINEARSRRDALAGRLDAPFQFAQTLADKRTELMNLEEAIKTTAGAQQTWTLTNTATGETVKGVAAENERAAKLKMIPWRKFSDAALDQWQAVPETPTEATPMLSRGASGPGIPIETLTAVRDRVASRMKNLPPVHVFASPDSPGVPGNLRAFIYQQGAQNDVEGALHQGEIYLFASGLRDALRAEQVLAEHEVTHYGLLGLLGKEGKRRVLQSIWARNARIRKQAHELGKRNKINYIDATEEILADMDAKELTSLSGWRGLVLALRDWFASHGFDNIVQWMNAALEGTLSDQARADLFAADLVRRARAFVENGPPRPVESSLAAMLARAWHGTPHIWAPEPGFPHGRPRLDKMGTGEGAQAYGWGFYTAQEQDVGVGYKNRLTGDIMKRQRDVASAVAAAKWFTHPKLVVKGKTYYDRMELQGDIASDRLGSMDMPDGVRKVFVDKLLEEEAGSLYQLDIPDATLPYLLDWDRPLSEQTKEVQALISDLADDAGLPIQYRKKMYWKDRTGQDFYNAVVSAFPSSAKDSGWTSVAQTQNDAFGSPRRASEFLASWGIVGNRYLDGQSRNRPLNDIKREFLAELPEDADFSEVSDMIGTGRFSPKNDALLKALRDDDWLGFDYPAQAISAALGKDLRGYDASPALLRAVESAKEGGTYNYVIWDQPTLDKIALIERNGEKLDAMREDGAALSRKLADDLPAQEKWLNAEARMRGFKDIEDLLVKDYPLFEKLAALWRKKHPAEVMMSRGLQSEYEVQPDTAINHPIDGARLKALRRAAARVESPERGITFRVDEEGRAIVTGPARTKVPDRFQRFANDNGLTLVVRRGPVDGITTNRGESRNKFIYGTGQSSFGASMPIEYRESGALYFGEINQQGIDRTGKTRFSRANQSDAAQRADAILADSTAKWRPLDAITKAGVKLVHFDRATQAVYAKAGKLLDALTPEKVKAGVVADYGVPGAVLDQRAMMQGRKRVQLRKTEQLIDKLASLTRAESRVAYEWMNNDNPQAADYLEAQLPPESIAVLKDVRDMIDGLSKEAVRLGQLDPETYKKHRYAYLRRSYAKHMEEMPGRDRAKRQRAIAILGDQYKGRGMALDVAMKSIQNVAPEWWQRKFQAGKADKGLKDEQFIRLERRAPSGEGTTPMSGIGDRSPGRLLEVAYWPAGEAIPTKFKDWDRNGTWLVRDTKGDKLVLWRDFTKQERETMGEVDEARFAIARTLHGMIQDIETGRYLNWLADNHAVIDPARVTGPVVEASERMRDAFAPEEWVKVPDTKIPGTNVMKYGKLAGRYLPGPIWNDVRQTVGFRFQPLGETYAALHSAWKTSKTALSPAVHMNNVMANFVMADWHDVGAGHILKSLRILLAASERDGKGIIGRTGNVASRAGISDREAAREILNRYQDSGGGIGTWITQEIQKEQMLPLIEALENELGLTGQNTANQIGVMAAVQKLMRLKFGEAWDAFKGSTPGGKVVQEARNLIGMYEAEDQVFRLAAWLKAKEDGINDLEAGKVARKSFLDYHINAPWVQMMRNTAFPFIAFTYRSVPMLLDVAANKPWKLMKLGMVLGALNAIGYALSGGDEDDERKLLPEEKSGSIWGIVPKLIRMPWNDAHGSPVFLDIRRFVPVGDIFDVGQPNTAVPVPPAVVPSGPLALLGELALNKSAFTGKPVTQETDTGTEKAGKVFDHLYKALAPNIAFLPGTHAWTSVTSAGGGKTDPFGREQSMAQAMASSVGFKLGSYPKDVLQYNAKRAAQAKVMEIDANINKLRREFARQGISEAEYQEKAQAQMEKKRRVMEELAEKAR